MLTCFAFCFDNLFLFKTRRTKHDLDLTFNTNVQAGFVNLLAAVYRGMVIIVRIWIFGACRRMFHILRSPL